MPNQYVNKVALSNGTTLIDLSQDTVTDASHIMSGYVGHLADGTQVTGTGQGGPSATAHTIYFEFSDGTGTTLVGYWDSSFISDAILATTPSTYGGKTVTLAQLDGVVWYEPANIPIGVQLIDFSKVTNDYVINSSGQAVAEQWYSCSDYTTVDPSMTFSFSGCRWFRAAYYDSSKAFLSSFTIDSYTNPSSYNSNIGDGTISSSSSGSSKIPSNAAYIRITSVGSPDDHELSLIRTA